MSILTPIRARGAALRSSTRGINADSIGQPYTARTDRYDLLESYYTNDVYQRHDAHLSVIQNAPGLYRHIRPIINPTMRAVDWWPGHVYPGTWTRNGLPTRSGKPNLLQYDPDTPEPLRLAVQQAFTWGNFGVELLQLVRTGAMLGDAFAEIEVNPERGKAYPTLIHPRYVADIEWNATGDVTMYRLAIPRFDERTQQSYTWGKEVTKDLITTFYNDEPRGYDDNDAETPNPYGFVPAVWVQHRNVGGQHGAAVVDGLLGKIDEINGSVSAIDDYLMRFTNQYIIVGTDSPVEARDAASGVTKGETTRRQVDPNATRESQKVLWAKGHVTTARMIENMGLGEAESHVQRLIDEIEKDLPEVTLNDKLLNQNDITGPGARALVQDVQHKLDESAANYDAEVIALGQMCVSVNAFELKAGTFGPRSGFTEAQKLFLPFDLSSYDRGDLAFALEPRSILPPSLLERANEAIAIESVKTPSGLAHLGFSPDQIWGEGLAPEKPDGLLAQREEAAGGAVDLFTRALNAGNVV